jgi:hypothetical protein
MLVQIRPRSLPTRQPRNEDVALMVSDIQQAHDRYISTPTRAPRPPLPPPPPPEGPPPQKPEKPGHHWLGGHLGLESGEQLLALKAEAHQVAADTVDAALHPASQVAHHALSSGMMVAASALGTASGALGLVLLKNGAEDVKEGVEHHDWAHTVEGVGSLIVGTRSLAAGAITAGHLLPHSLLVTKTATLAGKLVGPLGLVHGAIDAGLGVKDVVEGIQNDNRDLTIRGALGIGLGTSLMAAAAGGGLPAIASAGVFLAGRVWHDITREEE